jgi:hypothetical protein
VEVLTGGADLLDNRVWRHRGSRSSDAPSTLFAVVVERTATSEDRPDAPLIGTTERNPADEGVASGLLDKQTERMASRVGKHVQRFALIP